MVLSHAIRDNDNLLGYIDQVDVVPIHDEALPDPDERSLFFTKLLANHIFKLTELIRNKTVVTVLSKDLGIIAFRFDEHQPV